MDLPPDPVEVRRDVPWLRAAIGLAGTVVLAALFFDSCIQPGRERDALESIVAEFPIPSALEYSSIRSSGGGLIDQAGGSANPLAELVMRGPEDACQVFEEALRAWATEVSEDPIAEACGFAGAVDSNTRFIASSFCTGGETACSRPYYSITVRRGR